MSFVVVSKKYISTIDDDCFVEQDPSGKDINALEQHIKNLLSPSTPYFFNTLYDPYREGTDFVRDYPFSLREGAPTTVSHGLWLNIPDYDALTQLVKPHERNTRYVDALLTIPKGTLFPMCGMNLAFNRGLICPAMYFGLMGDGKLSKLEILRAGGNKYLVGKIPEEIGECSNLTELGLADTGLSGSLGKLSKLQILSIYTTMLSGEIPAELGNCSELVDLFLYENSLSGSIPPELEFLISDNNVSGSIPASLSNASFRQQLQVDTNQLSGPQELTKQGLSLKLLAIGQLLEVHEYLRGKVVLVQILNPARSRGRGIQDVQNETNSIANEINEKFGKPGYQPIVFVNGPVSTQEKASYYAISNVVS
ncbi:hypothetical protein K1719_027906 [Acacia pycnantha]|nr:hypothetical protein K1719_027906 [Acacia pycnantha]